MKARAAAAVLCALVLALLAGCTDTVAIKVQSQVPQALVDRLPVTIGVWYDPAFRGYVYREDSEERKDWSIDTGESQVATFEKVLGSMFERVVPVAGPPPAAGVDAVLVPSIEEAQFSTPQETRLGFYEAWFKYRLKLYQPDGALIGEWFLTAYGKSEPEFMRSADDAFTAAVQMALRDVGAKLTTGFASLPEVKAWLDGHAQPAGTSS
ncbi:MAG: hypothetical protein AB7Q97_20750 [Gammaproteobacteria bacterium]